MISTLRACEEYVSVIALMAKHADLCARDEQGKKPVDHVLQFLMGNAVYMSKRDHSIQGVAHRASEIEDELVLKLLSSLMNETILNSPCKWGYSYFGVFVLLGWWKLVQWALDAGADVSGNDGTNLLPIDAIFVERKNPITPPIPSEIFARLLHPTTVNRRINHRFNRGAGRKEALPFPLHKVMLYEHRNELITHLFNAGACIDFANVDSDEDDEEYELPMENYLNSMCMDMDSDLFRRLVPKSVGISPALFLKHLFDKSDMSGRRMFFKTIFYEHLKLSSNWHNLTLYDALPFPENMYIPNLFNLSINGQPRLWASSSTDVGFIIDALKTLGIRARNMPSCVPVPPHGTLLPLDPFVQTPQHKLDEVKNKWNDYRTFIPSLQLQCVRVIRSSLQPVTDARVGSLPLPKQLQQAVSLKEEMEGILSALFGDSSS